MTEQERLKFWLWLLEMEVEALRSVLSELRPDPIELSSFTQWQRANAIEQLKDSLVRP